MTTPTKAKQQTESKANKDSKSEPLEKQLWKAADKLRKNIDAAEYKHIVLGLIFLKYISDSFEQHFAKLQGGEGEFAGADPEDNDEYSAENVFFVPQEARWSYLQANARQPTIGKMVDAAMDALEAENAPLKGVLPKVFARDNLDPASLGQLIDLVGNIALGDAKSRSADVLGHVFEYFLGEFALAEGKQGGQFYTPRSVVELLVEMLEPYQGRVFDPCCGSGGMFVQSEKFVADHQGRVNDISIYGQESNQTTWRLAKMNLAIRGIEASQVKWNNEGSFLNDAHKDVKAEYIIANPPFNVSDWSGELLRTDGRWQYGVPPAGNANFAWLQHFIYHLSPQGQAGVVLAKGALTSKTSGEGDIRKALIEQGNVIDCIVNLPAKLFLNTQIPAALWFMRRGRGSPSPLAPVPKGEGNHSTPSPSGRGQGEGGGQGNYADRSNEILFIDARNLGHLINRRTKELSHEDIKQITDTYHAWRNQPSPQPSPKGGGSLEASPAGGGSLEASSAGRGNLEHSSARRGSLEPSPSRRGLGEGHKLPERLLENARQLRKNQTDAEALLWSLLRDRQLNNCKFRRQHPVEPYILDFYCHENKLAVELDGGQHNTESGIAKDKIRTEFLNSQGIAVLRFWNNDVLQNTESVLQQIYSSTLTPTLSQQEREYKDIPGFCASVSLDRVKELDYVLTPGRYVGLPDDEEDFNFAERFNALKAEFEAQLVEEEKLNEAIAENLQRIKP